MEEMHDKIWLDREGGGFRMLPRECRRSRQKIIDNKTHGDDRYRQTQGQVDCHRTQARK